MKITLIGHLVDTRKQIVRILLFFQFEHDGFHCLIDCGSGVLSSLQNYLPLEELDAVVISHYHADHIADIGSLQFSRIINFYLGHQVPPLPYVRKSVMGEA